MTELRPCPQCRRHVRVDEPTCPFCAYAQTPASPRTLPVGRLARAAVFAGATLASACAGSQTKTDDPAGGGDPVATADAGIAEEAVTAPIDAAPAPPDAEVLQPAKEPRPDHHNAKPYGAPPARARLV